MNPTKSTSPSDKKLTFQVLGRMLEHFGVHMYKRREVAISEFVSNSWDALANRIEILVPEYDCYNKKHSVITVTDNGRGMSFEEIRDGFLVIGRNRRKVSGRENQMHMRFDPEYDAVLDEANTPKKLIKRRVMGRKGIGKLAGFGIAKTVTVESWTESEGIEFTLDIEKLKKEDNSFEAIEIDWELIPPKKNLSPTGTRITLRNLKHGTPLDVEKLKLSLSRRYSRNVRGEMHIFVNGSELPDSTPELLKRIPEDKPFKIHKLSEHEEIRYWYGFTKDTMKNSEMWGFSVLVNGKLAQAPPFFFDVEATASGQHSTRYLIGEIEADFVDAGIEDEDDLISTDRQELDWADERLKKFLDWGKEFAKKTLRECTDFRGEQATEEISNDDDIQRRIFRLEEQSRCQVKGFIKILGNASLEKPQTRELVDTLLRAYEYRQFHDVISQIEQAATSPDKLAEMLTRLSDWKVMESRAILEIIKGRLEILDKFHRMLCNDAPETKSSKHVDNMHDLLAGNPWLLNPEWQVLSEEKKITTQLREWGKKDLPDFDGRYDFLALSGEGKLVVVEIKRPDYPAELDELNKLMVYAEHLAKAHPGEICMVFICGSNPNITEQACKRFNEMQDYEIRHWNTLFSRTRQIYGHYRAVLEGSISDPGFKIKEEEVIRTRGLLSSGMHRDAIQRAKGIPQQDVNYKAELKAIAEASSSSSNASDASSG